MSDHPGERWTQIKTWSNDRPRMKRVRFRYEYRAASGETFRCVAPSLDEARRLRDDWLAERTVAA